MGNNKFNDIYIYNTVTTLFILVIINYTHQLPNINNKDLFLYFCMLVQPMHRQTTISFLLHRNKSKLLLKLRIEIDYAAFRSKRAE